MEKFPPGWTDPNQDFDRLVWPEQYTLIALYDRLKELADTYSEGDMWGACGTPLLSLDIRIHLKPQHEVIRQGPDLVTTPKYLAATVTREHWATDEPWVTTYELWYEGHEGYFELRTSRHDSEHDAQFLLTALTPVTPESSALAA